MISSNTDKHPVNGWVDAGRDRPVLITGGAGFIGTNLADRLLRQGQPVMLFDNLSRPGVDLNSRWLRGEHGERARLVVGDVRDASAVRGAVRQCSAVFHFAAQVAVTTSLTDPVSDFEINARGTLNLLEALRHCDAPPPMLFTSTNKVYGALDNVPLDRDATRYRPTDPNVARHGVSEQTLAFYSPYGCSKGAADQYVLDYARTFGLPCVVFRMSCIYGPHQCGTEDQGWVAHFLRCAIAEQPITLFGDGRQVRDVLFVDDLLDAMLLARSHAAALAGQAFNIGGGPGQTVSLLELMHLLHELRGTPARVSFDSWRLGDQRYYVSDIRRFQQATGWQPRVPVAEGVRRLHDWLASRRGRDAVALPRSVA